MSNLTLITAFIDINRGDWSVFKRSVDYYFECFLPYLSLNHDIILFLDDRYLDKIKHDKVKVIPISKEWLTTNIHAYKFLEKESEIMKSNKYKMLISHRFSCPETWCPEYNIIQHSKIDFVSYAINNNLSKSEYYAWTDFGFFQDKTKIPKKGLDINKFDLDRINFQAINPLTNDDRNMVKTLIYPSDKIGGFFYLGHKNLLLKYQQLYHEVVQQYHNLGLVDDDQPIMAQCYFKNPDLFKVWSFGIWHYTYIYFQ
jgi:hypothetical protein